MTMQFDRPSSGAGIPATGRVVVNSSTKKITGVIVDNPGSGYSASQTVKITLFNKQKGSKATFTVNMVAEPSADSEPNRPWDGNGSVGLLDNYFHTGSPTGYTPDAGSPLKTGADPTVAYPNIASSTVTRYPHFEARTCTGVNGSGAQVGKTYCTWAEEQQNYANWAAYHSLREKLARTGIGIAFKPFPPRDDQGNELPANFRLGWGTINRLESNKNLDAGVSLFSQSRKDAFYTWLYGSYTNPSGDTPNRLAVDLVGKYFSRSDSNGPWGTTPLYTSVSTDPATTGGAEDKSKHATCRRSNMMLMTDGYWNNASPGLSNIDNTVGPDIAGSSYKYNPGPPYKDSVSNTLADAAMKYWVNDLRTDLANNVPTPIGVTYPTWQNMTFYGIGLGVYGTLEPNDKNLADLKNGDLAWPNAVENSPSAIDDMWHAAVNTGGSFLNAGDADSLTNSIEKMLATINKLTASEAGLAASTAELSSGTRKYKPGYITGSWIGNVEAYTLDATTGAQTGNPVWQVVTKDAVTGETTDKLPNAADRNIVVGNGATSGAKAVNFKFAEMPSALLTAMTGTVDAALIDYLRGDAANEGPTGIYRTRETPLGDIVNSHPVFIKSSLDLQYDSSGSTVPGKSAYRAFVEVKKARTEGVLFVGANDGMLHAFRDGPANEVIPTDGETVGGSEVFAYIPKAVLPNLRALARKTYGQTSDPHKYFVDGRLVETDAYLDGAWANLVLGTTGAGGKAVFALEVPADPLTIGASNVLWEVSSTTADFGELGYILTDVQTGVLPTGEWVAIFGNGYFSTSGSAQLFVVNLTTGALIQKIDTASGPNNGLGGVTVVRDDATKRIIGAYAGDLKGNLWKFDLSSTTSASGYVGLSGVPLLAVGATQPMTAAPALVKNPTGGYVVSVGTGKLFEPGDISTTTQQRMYGIWDSVAFGSTTTPVGATQTGITNLVRGIAAADSVIDWTCKSGWYVNLPNNGEREIYPLNVLSDSAIAVSSMSPSNVSSSACSKSGQGAGWSYRFKGTSSTCVPGPTPPDPVPPFCAGADCSCSSSSSAAACTCLGPDCSITTTHVEATVPPPLCGEELWIPIGPCTGGTQRYSVQTANCAPRIVDRSCPVGSSTAVKRQWRQLFMR
jgi:type IV pilus assembly protein PilY1